MVNNTLCSSTEPRFNFQYPHGSSQLSTPVPGGLIPSYRYTYGQNTDVHKIQINKLRKYISTEEKLG